MFTRKQYMNDECSHREYYAQLVSDHIRDSVLRRFGLERIRNSLKEDQHLNNIPLHLWDSLADCVSFSKYEELGDFETLAGCVCALKEAARQVAEGE